MTEQEFFNQLIEKTRIAWEASDVKERYPNEEWYYAICDTPIQRGKIIISGLNWGVERGHRPQAHHPENDYERKFKFAGLANRIIDDLNLTWSDINYTNMCFFRSPDTKPEHLTPRDWDLCFPLFKEYIDFIMPPCVLLLGQPTAQLDRESSFSKEYFKSEDAKKGMYLYSGKLFHKYSFLGLPHPNSGRWNPLTYSLIIEEVIRRLKDNGCLG